METRELNLEEKKAFIVFAINILTEEWELFICHCFNEFVESKTEMSEFSHGDKPEDYMHIIFPELFNELKILAEEDPAMEKYNLHNTRMKGDFLEGHKCPVWFSCELEERVHFLNDLNENL